jgi:hypothetical protein
MNYELQSSTDGSNWTTVLGSLPSITEIPWPSGFAGGQPDSFEWSSVIAKVVVRRYASEIFLSDLSSTNWSPIGGAAIPNSNQKLAALADGSYIWTSPDGGTSYIRTPGSTEFVPWNKPQYSNYMGRMGTDLVAFYGSQFYRSTDNGFSWTTSQLSSGINEVTRIGSDFIGYSSSSNKLMRSSNGTTWAEISAVPFNVSQIIPYGTSFLALPSSYESSSSALIFPNAAGPGTSVSFGKLGTLYPTRAVTLPAGISYPLGTLSIRP